MEDYIDIFLNKLEEHETDFLGGKYFLQKSRTCPDRREAREEKQGALRQRSKTPSQAVANAAERPHKVRCQAYPAEDRQFKWALVQASPRNLGEFGPCGQIRPQRLFSFGPCTARFLFSAQPKRENGGCIAQPSSWLKSPPPARAGIGHYPRITAPPPRASSPALMR